jgi:hypothetical protein
MSLPLPSTKAFFKKATHLQIRSLQSAKGAKDALHSRQHAALKIQGQAVRAAKAYRLPVQAVQRPGIPLPMSPPCHHYRSLTLVEGQ